MPQSPMTVTLASSTDEHVAVEIEVAFVAEDEAAPLDELLFAAVDRPTPPATHATPPPGAGAGQPSGSLTGANGGNLGAVRQAALALGARVLGAAGAVHVLGGMPLRAIVGLGPRAEITLETLRRAAAH